MQRIVGSEKIVLVVDDQPEVGRALALGLRHHCEVVLADGAEQGEKLLSEKLFAVLTDYDMPGRNGIWLLTQARERFPGVFRAMISGCPPDDLERHVKSGVVQGFSMKPHLPDTLLALLREPT
ncbi:MAG TPA: response regulator [Polyangia bacterium]|nr:response regulator [Polyangia bacterium]